MAPKKAAAAAPKPAAAPAAAPAAPAAAAAASVAMPKLETLAEMKKWVLKHEVKMDDAAELVKDEPNKTKKKELENKLKALQKDAIYLKVQQMIKDKEAEEAVAAERAALAGGKTDKKAVGKDDKKGKTEAAAATVEKADEKIMSEIDAAFAGAGKDAAKDKETAVSRLEGCSASTPFVINRLDKLIPLFDNSKLGAAAIKSACCIIESVQPKGHGIGTQVIPKLLEGMSDKKWKIKAGCIEALLPALKQMASTPYQLSQCLPLIVPKLAEAALEVRAEIRKATTAVLGEIGALVASPEIKKLSQDLVTALAEPTNQKHTQAVLSKMGSATFLSLIDPASLSLLMPVLVRGLKERDSASKKWSAQIFGATAMLVQDVDSMKPYLKTVVPMLQASLTDPVAEVQREGAKAFGVLEQVLPEYSRLHNQPWLFGQLRNGDIGEQKGAALALAEVILKGDKDRGKKLIPEIELAASDDKPSIRRGVLELLECMPHAMKMDFVPYITRLFPKMLMGITGDKDKDEDAGLTAATSLVARFGDLCPHALLPAFVSVYAATLHGDSSEERNRQLVVRDKTAMLLGKLADKILEHKRFGQDLLTTEDCTNKETREGVLVMLFIMGRDFDASVKRYANGAWKTSGGAPKLQKAIMPSIEKMLTRLRTGELGLGGQKLAPRIIDELVKAGDIEAPAGDEPAAVEKFMIPPPADREENSEAAAIVSGKVGEFQRQMSNGAEIVDAASSSIELFKSTAAFAALPVDVLTHLSAVADSVLKECVKKRLSGPKMSAKMADEMKVVIEFVDNAPADVNAQLPFVAEAITRATLGDQFDALAAGGDGDDNETLLHVESLLLMYGGGKLLLKDTILQMKKNCCYGVVGPNGAGKTTLMKEIANHSIVGMPEELTCVHVDDSKLGVMSKSHLSVFEYSIKMAKDIGVDTASKETLTSVGFDESKLDQPVAELSTGWRMRLTLAVNMLKNADLVLLDEPTNHLDEQSVEWLSGYVGAIKGCSVMVISHEPKFLDKICTHIMAYVDKKLEYTKGDFHAFAAAKGLTKDQIDQMLSGNLSFDSAGKDKDGEEGGDVTLDAPVSGPPKLSFPIPGSCEGVKSGSRSVLEAKSLSFKFPGEGKEYLVLNANLKLSLNARVAICGRNGCGKSTLMDLLCSEMCSSENKEGALGEVWRHCNLRMAYMKQDHLKALGPFFETSSYTYISQRFKDGHDGDLQKRLIEPENEEEAGRRAKLAKEMGKYGNPVEDLVSRTKLGNELAYEVQWAGLNDPKQNTVEKLSKLKAMGLDKVVIACDERLAAKAIGLDQRPLTRREIVRHVEAFGIDEEMCCNQLIKGFSAGQKVRLSLSAMFWTKPHLIAVDEPTNYLDVETVEALAKAFNNFRGGIVMIEPKTDFVAKICNEKWHMENGVITAEKMANGAKRQA